MAAVMYALTSPAAPIVWWAVNTPEVTDALAGALGLESSAEGAGRRLQAAMNQPWFVFVAVGIAIVLPILIWGAVGTVYKSSVTDKRPPVPPSVPESVSMAGGRDFKFQLCSCCDDCQYMMHGWCLGPMRAADTFHTVGGGSFWCVVIAFFITWIFAQAISGGISYAVRDMDFMPERMRNGRQSSPIGNIAFFIAQFFLAFWLAKQRRILRERLGDPSPGKSFVMDFCTYWWCSCCNIVQDARQIDEAEGVKVECCCKLIKTEPPMGAIVMQPVGNAVAVGQVIG